MRQISPEPELATLLAKYASLGGVLDYVFLEPEIDRPAEELHRMAALEAMAAIDQCLEQRAESNASHEHPIEMFFRVHCDETKLTGQRISFSSFWGSDDVEPKGSGDVWRIPNVDGYKTAFFHPPYGLGGSSAEKVELFTGLNQHVLGDDPARVEIFSWSTDWSNYFDAGHEWWGAFFWTIRSSGTSCFAAIGASSTD
jgi:hypothetical protein